MHTAYNTKVDKVYFHNHKTRMLSACHCHATGNEFLKLKQQQELMYASSAVSTRLKKITIKWFISEDKILKISFGVPTPQCTAYLHIFITMPRKYHGKKHLQLPVWQPWFPSGPKPLLEWITDIFPAVIIPLGVCT